MKRVIEVNIGGINFTMEDDAYFMLKGYLKRFEATIPDKKEAREVMEDVEARVAEIFQKEQKFENQVIDIPFVRIVIEHLGEVEENAEEQSAESAASNNTNEQGYTKGDRYLYRDPDDKKIAGVCSGLSAYFGIDVTLIRILFVVVTAVYGSALILYIILWLCVPEAKTVASKLKMRGFATTFENMRKFSAEQKQQNL